MQGSVIRPPAPCGDTCRDCSYHCRYQGMKPPSLGEALEHWLGRLGEAKTKEEEIPLTEALNRISACQVVSKIHIPVTNCASHDGIAICHRECKEILSAGNNRLEPGQFLHCPMGAVVPERFDTVLHAEQCTFQKDGSVLVYQLPVLYQSVKLKGSSVAEGEVLMDAGERMTPSHLAMLQYAGYTSVKVKKRPVTGILPIGDDLKEAGELPGPGEMIDGDSIYVMAVAKECGADPFVLPVIPDDREQIEKALEQCIKTCDIIVTIGGIGKGEAHYGDLTAQAIRTYCHVSAHGVQVGPGGKNMLLADASGIPVIGLPGPPHALIMMAPLFLPPAVERYYGCVCYEPRTVDVELLEDFPNRGDGESIWEPRLCLTPGPQGYLGRIVDKMGDTVSNLIHADASVAVTGDLKNYRKGCHVKAKLLCRESEIRRKWRKREGLYGGSDTGR